MNLDQWKCGCVPISGLDVCRFWFGRLEKWLSAVNRGFPFTATEPVWTDLNTFEQAWSPKFNIKQSKKTENRLYSVLIILDRFLDTFKFVWNISYLEITNTL